MPKAVKVTRDVDENELEDLYKTSPDPRIRLRALMVLKVATGVSCTQVGEFLRISKNTVTKWVRRFNDFGVEGYCC